MNWEAHCCLNRGESFQCTVEKSVKTGRRVSMSKYSDLAGETFRNLSRAYLALTHPAPLYQHLYGFPLAVGNIRMSTVTYFVLISRQIPLSGECSKATDLRASILAGISKAQKRNLIRTSIHRISRMRYLKIENEKATGVDLPMCPGVEAVEQS